ncbi:MAG: 2-amino-4-hydroxy-6-hydroxymethyldihydropteridine diphosphokinase [Gammaproteobacteria bacterium]|nr:2-amino-4-hydroxy-6-hydroxymethyldihydropteridine diphosphokinase [Gammaproteobacteria bacterium]
MSDVTAYIGLGSNLVEPQAQVRAGQAALATLPRTTVEACSVLYASAPVGLVNQPDFVNAACRVRTTLPARTLMQALLDIERQYGRVRGTAKGGPRTLDLDLLLYGDLVLNETDLILPHPRLHERAFVLRPLCELDAGLVIPGRGHAADLLAACTGQRVERLERC